MLDYTIWKQLQPFNFRFTASRIEYFENKLHSRPNHPPVDLPDLRKERVPRFLFRAWHANSGGGSACTINDETQIVPHLFMHEHSAPDFYDLHGIGALRRLYQDSIWVRFIVNVPASCLVLRSGKIIQY